jgi:hypothetical protein
MRRGHSDAYTPRAYGSSKAKRQVPSACRSNDLDGAAALLDLGAVGTDGAERPVVVDDGQVVALAGDHGQLIDSRGRTEAKTDMTSRSPRDH